MRTLLIILIAALATLAVFRWVDGADVSLGATVRWNCTNMMTNPHPVPLSFTNDASGSWSVYLEDGSVLYGRVLAGGFMRWDWQDAHWMTDGRNVVYCESDLKSISILLAQ